MALSRNGCYLKKRREHVRLWRCEKHQGQEGAEASVQDGRTDVLDGQNCSIPSAACHDKKYYLLSLCFVFSYLVK